MLNSIPKCGQKRACHRVLSAMSNLKTGINCTYIEEANENLGCSYNYNISIVEMQSSSRGNRENHHWEKILQNKTINCSGKTIYLLFKMMVDF